MTAIAREHVIGVRLSDEELSRLDAIAGHYGLTRADVVRMLVKKTHDVDLKLGVLAKSADRGRRKRRTVRL